MTVSRRRVFLLAGVVLLLLGGAIAWAAWPEEETLPPVEEVARAHREFVDAILDRDYERVWERLGVLPRNSVEVILQGGEELGSEMPGWVPPEEMEGMDARDLFLAMMRRIARDAPDELAREEEALREARTVEVRLNRDDATVRLDAQPGLGPGIYFVYVREPDGVWRFWRRTGQPSLFAFKTLEKKLEVRLPRTPLDPVTVDLVVEIASSGVDEARLGALRRRIADLDAGDDGKVTVLLDADPGARWGDVIRVHDAVLHADHEVRILYSRTGAGSWRSGLRVNGEPLTGAEDEGSRADQTGDHPTPAVERILGLR
jgi:hypothetical protein